MQTQLPSLSLPAPVVAAEVQQPTFSADFFAGCAMFLVSLAFFALVIFGGAEAFELLRWIFGY